MISLILYALPIEIDTISVYFLQILTLIFMQFKESEGPVQDLFAFKGYLKYNLMEQMGVGNRIYFPDPNFFSVIPSATPKNKRRKKNVQTQ